MSILFLSGLANASPVGLEKSGRTLYLTSGGYGCGVCHGPVAEGAGQAGGLIRGATLEQINQSLISVAPMQPLSLVLSEGDRLALASYLTSLRLVSLVSIEFNGEVWKGRYSSIENSKTMDLVVYNDSFDAVDIDLSGLGVGMLKVEALQRLSFRVDIEDLDAALESLDMSFTPF